MDNERREEFHFTFNFGMAVFIICLILGTVFGAFAMPNAASIVGFVFIMFIGGVLGVFTLTEMKNIFIELDMAYTGEVFDNFIERNKRYDLEYEIYELKWKIQTLEEQKKKKKTTKKRKK